MHPIIWLSSTDSTKASPCLTNNGLILTSIESGILDRARPLHACSLKQGLELMGHMVLGYNFRWSNAA